MMLSSASLARSASRAVAVGATPDSMQLVQLHDQFSAQKVVRLRGSFGTQEVNRPRFDSAGVSSPEWEERALRRPGLFAPKDAEVQPLPQPVAWRDISEIQIGHSMTGIGALAGFLIGTGGIAVPYLASQGNATEGEAFAAVSISLSVIATSTVIGAIIGSRCGWRTAWHAPPAAPP